LRYRNPKNDPRLKVKKVKEETKTNDKKSK
jgi:hypothetical protein